MNRSLFCVVRGRDSDWEAFCLDFDLAVQGRTAEEAVGRLKQAVLNYIESALEEDEQTRHALLKRAAPWTTQVMWRLRIALWVLFGKKKADDKSTFGFPIPCPG